MIMKFLVCIVLVLGQTAFGQKSNVVFGDDFNFELIKAKKEPKITTNSMNYSVYANSNQKKIRLVFKASSNSGKRVRLDPNKFYLLDEKRRERRRPIDIRLLNLSEYQGFPRLLHEPLIDKDYQIYLLKYKPEIRDTFKDYGISGYKDCEAKISIAPNSTIFKRQKPKTITYYYGYKKLSSRRVGLSFNVGKDFKNGKVYFGEQLLSEIHIE